MAACFFTTNISFYFSNMKLKEARYMGCLQEAVPETIGTDRGELQRSNVKNKADEHMQPDGGHP
jgi:uncharacterized YccA/Bax inhibitor family protein